MAAAPVPRPFHSWSAPTSVNGSPDASPTRIQASSLQTQIEFYFSPQNLTSDAYLRSQMDEERFVPVDVIAEFKLVKKITSDLDLIVESIRRSKLLELDETMTKVRASMKATERTTIILRDIPADTPIEQIRAIFDSEACGEVVAIRADIGDTWFVSFPDEETCLRTAEHLASMTFAGRPIRYRVKSENQTRAFHQEKLIPPPFYPVVLPRVYPVGARPPSWNIRMTSFYPGDTAGAYVPSMAMGRRPAPQTPGDRRKPIVRKPRDGGIQPGASTPNGSVRPRKPRPTRIVPFSTKPEDACVDGVAPVQSQPDLSLENFPALPSSGKTPASSCPASPCKEKSYAAKALEDPFANLFLSESPAGGQVAPASTSPSSAIEECRIEKDEAERTISYASIARRATDSKTLTD